MDLLRAPRPASARTRRSAARAGRRRRRCTSPCSARPAGAGLMQSVAAPANPASLPPIADGDQVGGRRQPVELRRVGLPGRQAGLRRVEVVGGGRAAGGVAEDRHLQGRGEQLGVVAVRLGAPGGGVRRVRQAVGVGDHHVGRPGVTEGDVLLVLGRWVGRARRAPATGARLERQYAAAAAPAGHVVRTGLRTGASHGWTLGRYNGAGAPEVTRRRGRRSRAAGSRLAGEVPDRAVAGAVPTTSQTRAVPPRAVTRPRHGVVAAGVGPGLPGLRRRW